MEDFASSAPLLTKKGKEGGGEEKEEILRKTWTEVKLLWYIAGPAILTTVFQYSLMSVTQTFAGHISTIALAAVGIQNLVVSGIGFGAMVSISISLSFFFFCYFYLFTSGLDLDSGSEIIKSRECGIYLYNMNSEYR